MSTQFTLDASGVMLLAAMTFTTFGSGLSCCDRYLEPALTTDNITSPGMCPQDIQCSFTENKILIQWRHPDNSGRSDRSSDYLIAWRESGKSSFHFFRTVIPKVNNSFLTNFTSKTNTTYVIRVSSRNYINTNNIVHYRTYKTCPYQVNIQSTNDRDTGVVNTGSNGMTLTYIGIGLALTILCIIGVTGLCIIKGKSKRANIPQAMNTSEVPILNDAADDIYNHLAVTHKEKGRPSIDSTYHHMAPNEPKRPVAEAEGASLSDQDTDRKFSNQYAEVCLLNGQQDEDGAARSTINCVMIQGAVTPLSWDSGQDEVQGSLGTDDDVCDVTSSGDLYCNVGENILSDTDNCIKRHVAPNGDIYSDVN